MHLALHMYQYVFFWKIILNNRRCLHHVGVSDLYQSPKMTNHPPKQHENLQLGGVEPSTRHLRWSANVDNKTWDWAGSGGGGVTGWFPWKNDVKKGEESSILPPKKSNSHFSPQKKQEVHRKKSCLMFNHTRNIFRNSGTRQNNGLFVGHF